MKAILRFLYRHIQKHFIKEVVLPFFFSKQRIFEAFSYKKLLKNNLSSCYWFHASSVGELESLWPLILLSADSGIDLVVSIFSESAKKNLDSLKNLLEQCNVKILYMGYSPWEGEWGMAFSYIQPTFFITAKYEAWPDLWISLEEKKIPLIMISIHARKSLKIARFLCKFMGAGLPQLFLLPCISEEVDGLRSLFPEAVINVVGEPRWDQVYRRFQKKNEYAQKLIQDFSFLRRPWGVIGSAWVEDLEFLEPFLKKQWIELGTIWIVPHEIHGSAFERIEKKMFQYGLSFLKTSDRKKELKIKKILNSFVFILVDEMGLLTELYSSADWAFVGGGFSAGIHSTIEPAFYGIPISAGPIGTQKFYEVEVLKKTGQLSILKTKDDLKHWLESRDEGLEQKKNTWMQQAQRRLGASQKIHTFIESIYK